jgi:Uma2 family endonuclease
VVKSPYAALNFALKRQPYQAFLLDQRLCIPEKRIHTYPDVMGVASPLEFKEGRKDTLINPVVVVEVLSQSTQDYDRVGKFAAYRTISSFQECVLVDQYSTHVEQYVKTQENKWIFAVYETADDLLSFASVPCEISLADLYDRVEFRASDESEA